METLPLGIPGSWCRNQFITSVQTTKTLSLSWTHEIWCFFSLCAIVCVRGKSVDQQLPLVTTVNRLKNVIIYKKGGRLNCCHLLLIKVTALSNSGRQAFVHSKWVFGSLCALHCGSTLHWGEISLTCYLPLPFISSVPATLLNVNAWIKLPRPPTSNSALLGTIQWFCFLDFFFWGGFFF